jgi:glycosyltransferase involved in cell wall biosynthesis
MNRPHVKIVGDGPLKTDLEDMLKTKGIKDIEFTGRKSYQECIMLLQDTQFLILPSLCYENFPVVIMEAYASGKPVIASGLGAMAELVEEGKTGLLFEPGNPEDLADKMQWMVENEDACIEMGKNARKVFEKKYTAEKNYEILMKIYNKLLAHGS